MFSLHLPDQIMWKHNPTRLVVTVKVLNPISKQTNIVKKKNAKYRDIILFLNCKVNLARTFQSASTNAVGWYECDAWAGNRSVASLLTPPALVTPTSTSIQMTSGQISHDHIRRCYYNISYVTLYTWYLLELWMMV